MQRRSSAVISALPRFFSILLVLMPTHVFPSPLLSSRPRQPSCQTVNPGHGPIERKVWVAVCQTGSFTFNPDDPSKAADPKDPSQFPQERTISGALIQAMLTPPLNLLCISRAQHHISRAMFLPAGAI
jgi:hypothetical protein